MLFIVFGLFFVGSVQLSIAPYQLGWSLEARTWYLLAYLILEGFGACVSVPLHRSSCTRVI